MSSGEWDEGMTNKELILAIHERLDSLSERIARKPDRTEVFTVVGGVVALAGIVIQALM